MLENIRMKNRNIKLKKIESKTKISNEKEISNEKAKEKIEKISLKKGS